MVAGSQWNTAGEDNSLWVSTFC